MTDPEDIRRALAIEFAMREWEKFLGISSVENTASTQVSDR